MTGRSGARPDTVTAVANAKVNLFLRVLGRWPDGFHDIQTLVVPISLADRLEVHAVADQAQFRTLSLSLDVTGDPDLTRGVPVDESNLAMRAAAALADRIHPFGFADILLDKRIPSAAGLGGGSADAAAVLRALATLWRADLTPGERAVLAAEIGSDVPALVHGGAVVASGRGERVRPAPVAPLQLALVTFGFGVRTADAYRWWDEDGGGTGPDPTALIEAAAGGDLAGIASGVFNDLEAPVMKRHPEIRRAASLLRDAGAVGAVMCGSGPSLAAILRGPEERLGPPAERELGRISGRSVAYPTTV